MYKTVLLFTIIIYFLISSNELQWSLLRNMFTDQLPLGPFPDVKYHISYVDNIYIYDKYLSSIYSCMHARACVCNYIPPRDFWAHKLIRESWIERATMELPCIQFTFPRRILCMRSSCFCFIIGCTCCVWWHIPAPCILIQIWLIHKNEFICKPDKVENTILYYSYISIICLHISVLKHVSSFHYLLSNSIFYNFVLPLLIDAIRPLSDCSAVPNPVISELVSVIPRPQGLSSICKPWIEFICFGFVC